MTEVIDLRDLRPGLRLRVRRVLVGASQAQLARMLGEYRPRISEAECDDRDVGRGRARAAVQTRMAEALTQLERARAAQEPTPAGDAGAT